MHLVFFLGVVGEKLTIYIPGINECEIYIER